MRTLIVDLDGTLVECSRHYTETVVRGAEYLSSVTGFPVAQCRATIEQLDLVAASAPHAFTLQRFPQSFAAAAYALCHLSLDEEDPRHVAPTEVHAAMMEGIGYSVYSAEYALFPHVLHTLLELKSDYRILIYTKGEGSHAEELQGNKVSRHGLDRLAEAVFITPYKTPEALQALLDKFSVDPSTAWYVGDSLRDDIACAKACGIENTVLSVEERAYPWAYDFAEVEPKHVINSFAQLLDILPNGDAQTAS